MANEDPIAPLLAPYSAVLDDSTGDSATNLDALKHFVLKNRILGAFDPRDSNGGSLDNTPNFADNPNGGGNTGTDPESESEPKVQIPSASQPIRAYSLEEEASFDFQIQRDYDITSADWVVANNSRADSIKSLNAAQFVVVLESSKLNYRLWTTTILLTEGERHLEEDMFLVINYQRVAGDRSGFPTGSYASRIFTVLRSGTTDTEKQSVESELASFPYALGGDTVSGSYWDPSRTTPFSNPSEDSKGSDSDSDNSDTSDKTGDVTSSVPKPTSNKPGGGLTIGAKAGIGVACGIVGLALIGLAIFFFLRYRRRKAAAAAQPAPYDNTSSFHAPPNDYLQDKEAQAHVADSPQSEDIPGRGLRDSTGAYADPASSSSAPTAAAAAAAAAATAAAPGTPSITNRSLAPSETLSRPEVPSTVAHLVEEGMTDAEIRRLEEEERALDHAIEQAAQRK